MARLFVFLVAIVAVLALAEGGKGDEKGAKGDKKGGRAAKKCAKNIKTFESCLKKGYQSKAGCISEDGELSKKDMKKCGRFEKQLKKCDYSCDKKEVEPQPKPQPEPQPEPQPDPQNVITAAWQQIPGGLTKISKGDSGVWGVNSNDNIFKLNSNTDGNSWTQIAGGLVQVSSGHLFGGSTKPMESTSTWETTDGNRSADD